MSMVGEIDIKNHTYYFSMTKNNIKKLDPNNVNMDKKWCKNILIYYIGYLIPNHVNPL